MTWVQPHLPNQALSVPPFPRSRVGSVRRKVCAMRKSHTREIHTQIFCGENPETWLTTQNMNFFYYFLVPFLSLSLSSSFLITHKKKNLPSALLERIRKPKKVHQIYPLFHAGSVPSSLSLTAKKRFFLLFLSNLENLIHFSFFFRCWKSISHKSEKFSFLSCPSLLH